MKTCVIRRRFFTSEASGTAVTVNLEPGFGTPLACLVFYTETSASTDSFDTSLALRTMGIGLIGSTDSSITSTLVYRSLHATMTDAATGTSYRRQNSTSRYAIAQNTTGATLYWQGTAAAFSADTATFTFAASTPQTNGHLDCIMTFFGGSDLTVGIGTHLMPTTAGGSNSYTQLSFQPDLIIAATTITSINGGLSDDFRLCFGAAQRTPAAQYGVYMHGEAGASVDLGTVSSNANIFTYSTSNGVGPYTFTMSGITTGGFTLTSSDAAAGTNNFMAFIALKSSTPTDFSLTDLSTPTGTGNSFSATGSTFVPKTIIGAATNCTAYGTRQTTSPGADSIQFFGGNRSADSLYWNGIGTIQTATTGTAVTGTSTAFLRLAPGDKLYRTDNTLIGTISAITTNTALTLTANAANANAAGTSFVYTNPGQYCISFGDEDAATTSAVFSRMSSKALDLARSSGGSPSSLDVASLTDFDARNGYNFNFTTASGSSRKGFVIAFKNTDDANQGRRRKNLNV